MQTITVGTQTFAANAALQAVLAACPGAAAHIAANPGVKRLGEATFAEGGLDVTVEIVERQIDILVKLGRDLELSFMLEECESEHSFQVVYLGRNGDMADDLANAGRRRRTLGDAVQDLPDVLRPFAATPIVDYHFDEGFSDGKDYVALDLGEPTLAMPIAA